MSSFAHCYSLGSQDIFFDIFSPNLSLLWSSRAHRFIHSFFTVDDDDDCYDSLDDDD